MTKTQTQRAELFRDLHARDRGFILPNPWDAGSARLLAGLGFEALATTSAGFAATQGRADYAVTREEKLAHVRTLVEATALPLTADLENGFGDAPETCAETIRFAADAGLVGGSIEDFSGDPATGPYELALAADRVRAAVEAADALSFPFLVTARAENFFTGTPDLADTITRLQAYQEAGAHVLYAPGLRTLAQIKSVLASVDRPLNVLLGPMEEFVPLAELFDLGVARISMGSALSNAAFGAAARAARELLHEGTLGFLGDTISGDALADLMAKGAG